MTAAIDTTIFLKDRERFDDLMGRLARVDDGLVRLTRRELVERVRALVDAQRLVNERCLFLALEPGGELLLLIRRYYAFEREVGAALDEIAATSPRSPAYDGAVARARQAVAELFETVQAPLARLAAERLTADTLGRLGALAASLREGASELDSVPRAA